MLRHVVLLLLVAVLSVGVMGQEDIENENVVEEEVVEEGGDMGAEGDGEEDPPIDMNPERPRLTPELVASAFSMLEPQCREEFRLAIGEDGERPSDECIPHIQRALALSAEGHAQAGHPNTPDTHQRKQYGQQFSTEEEPSHVVRNVLVTVGMGLLVLAVYTYSQMQAMCVIDLLSPV